MQSERRGRLPGARPADRTVTYYRDGSVEITSQAVEVDGRKYPLRELAEVYHSLGGRERSGWRTLGVRVAMALTPVAVGAAALGVALVAVRWEGGLVPRLILGALAAMLALATLPLLDLVLGGVEKTYDRGTRVREIWVRWRGAQVLLLRTGDQARFGRIYRALQRAVEQQ